MNVVQENIDKLNAVVTVSIDPSDYKEQYEKSVKNYSKQVSMPGFRPGKVPTALIKKKHGPGILVDELQKIVDKAITDHIKENKLNILGQPLPVAEKEVGDWVNPKEFEFAYELGLAPDFDVKITEKDKFNFYTIKVDEKMIDEEVDRLAKQFGSLVDNEKSEEKDLIYGEFTQLDAEGNIMEEGIKNATTIFTDSIEDKKIKKQFLGKKVGAKLTVDLFKMDSNHDNIARMLGVTHEEVHHISYPFQFDITAVKKVEPAEMNEDLFKKVFPTEEIKDEKEFKASIEDKIADQFDKNSEELLKRDVSEYLIDKLKLDLPKEFLIKWTALANKKSEEEAAAEFDQNIKGLQWQLIMNKITEDQEIKVEFDEVMAFTKEKLIQNYAQYGMPAPEEEELQQTAMRVLQNQDEANQIFEMLREGKLFDHIKNEAKITDKEISFDKFKEMAEKQV